MAAKKKKAVEKKEETQEEAKRPVVTQVVEVVEVVPAGEEQASSAPEEEEVPAAEEREEERAEAEENKAEAASPEEEEKRKEVVEELYEEKPPFVAPDISVHKKGGLASLLAWVGIVVGVAVVTGGGLYIFVRGGLPALPFVALQPTPTPTPLPTPTPTPTPEPVKRADFTIEVLNGGGTPGAAGKMKTILEEKGYSVGSTGNTEEYTYEQTEIFVKSGNEALLSTLEMDLKDSYVIGSKETSLSDDASYDARVIVGKE